MTCSYGQVKESTCKSIESLYDALNIVLILLFSSEREAHQMEEFYITNQLCNEQISPVSWLLRNRPRHQQNNQNLQLFPTICEENFTSLSVFLSALHTRSTTTPALLHMFLQRQRRNDHFCNVIIEIGSYEDQGRLIAHKNVLCAASPLFYSALLKEKEGEVIRLEDTSKVLMEQVNQFTINFSSNKLFNY